MRVEVKYILPLKKERFEHREKKRRQYEHETDLAMSLCSIGYWIVDGFIL